MAKCENCGRKPVMGRSVSFSHRVTPKLRRPNIQKVTIMVNGQLQQVKYCTRCIRTLSRTR